MKHPLFYTKLMPNSAFVGSLFTSILPSEEREVWWWSKSCYSQSISSPLAELFCLLCSCKVSLEVGPSKCARIILFLHSELRWESGRWWRLQDHLCRGHDFRMKTFGKHNPSIKWACEHLDNYLLAQDIAECLPLSEIGFFHNLRGRTAIIFIISLIFVGFYAEST